MAEYGLGEAELGTSVDLEPLREGIDTAEQESSSRFAKIGDVIGGALKVGILAAGAAIVAGVAGIGVAAFGVASDVQQASNDIQAELGVTAEKADELGQLALKVWGNNWGDSIDDVKTSIVEVRQQMKGLSDDELQGATEKALAIRDVFGAEVTESTNAANVLMEKFGLTSDQAFDFVAKGFQKGLNNSGDFLESLTEYGVQFSEAGFKADEFFSVLESGQQGFSSLGTDKAADLIKEFRIRMTDLSDTSITALNQIGRSWSETIDEGLVKEGPKARDAVIEAAQAFEDLGLSFSEHDIDQLTKGYVEFGDIFGGKVLDAISNGSITVADAFSMMQDGLSRVEDPLVRNVHAVSLFGTQWEDIGEAAVMGINPGLTSLDSMAGATDSLNAKYNNFPALFEGFKRSFLVAIEPVGQKLLEVANAIMPSVQIAFAWLQENLPPIIDGAVVAIDGFIAGLKDIRAQLQPIVAFVGDNLTPILAGLAAVLLTVVVPAFVAWAGGAATAAASTIAALAPVIIPLAAIGAAVAVLVAAWQRDWGGIRTTVTAFWENTGRPIFDQLKGWLSEKLPVALQTLSDFWTNTLQPALKKVWDFVNANIIPILGALANVWLALVKKEIELLSALWSNVLWPALQKVGDFIGTTVIPKLSELARVVSETLGPKLEWLNTNILQPVLSSLGYINTAVQSVIGFFGDLARSIDAIEIPSWLQGHSPPPLANWFGNIADEAGRAAGVVDGMAASMVKFKKFPDAELFTPWNFMDHIRPINNPTFSAADMRNASTGVHITLEEKGLKGLIQATVKEEMRGVGESADTRIRTR